MEAAKTIQTRELLLLVADARRWEILGLLGSRGRTVSDLVDSLDIAQPAVSHHLSRLHRAGLVEAVADGRSRRYEWAKADPASAVGELQALMRRWFDIGRDRGLQGRGPAGRRAALEVHLL